MAHRGDPIRWLEPGSDAPEELRRVLSSAGEDGGGADALASLAGKLPLSGGATPSLGGAAGTASGASKKAVLSWKLAAWIAGGTAAVGAAANLLALAPSGADPGAMTRPVLVAQAPSQAEAETETETETETRAASEGAPAEVSGKVSEVAPGEAPAKAPERSSPRARDLGEVSARVWPASSTAAVAPRTGGQGSPIGGPEATTRPAAGADSLAAEAKLLLQAKADLAANPRKALTATDQHDAVFSSGALAEEREVIRIEALVRLGKRDEAASAAAAFRARHPRSSHLPRVERLVR